MADKILLLNSGGFDSVLMALRVSDAHPNAELHSLFFDYGQPNLKEEQERSNSVAEEVHAEQHIIYLPKFDWTKHDFYKGTSVASEQYVEYRNLVFLSYAASLAESLGCTKIFMATIFCAENESMKDCNQSFIDSFNATIQSSGIRVVTPFAYMFKDDLINLVKYYDLKPHDYFSCNNPQNGKPCGECIDCKTLLNIYKVKNEGNKVVDS